MKHIIPIAALAALAAIAWHVGGLIPAHTMTLALGVLFGLFAGIPAALIALSADKRVRHDHYVHIRAETPVESHRCIVVGNRPALPVNTQNRIEVRR